MLFHAIWAIFWNILIQNGLQKHSWSIFFFSFFFFFWGGGCAPVAPPLGSTTDIRRCGFMQSVIVIIVSEELFTLGEVTNERAKSHLGLFHFCYRWSSRRWLTGGTRSFHWPSHRTRREVQSTTHCPMVRPMYSVHTEIYLTTTIM